RLLGEGGASVFLRGDAHPALARRGSEALALSSANEEGGGGGGGRGLAAVRLYIPPVLVPDRDHVDHAGRRPHFLRPVPRFRIGSDGQRRAPRGRARLQRL